MPRSNGSPKKRISGTSSSYTASSGAQVFATGSMQWNWGLDDFGFGPQSFAGPSRVHPAAQQMTHNLLRTFSGRTRVPVIFVKSDTGTSGDWRQPICAPNEIKVYGADGYKIANGTAPFNSIPAYVQLSLSGQTDQTWVDKSSEPRALLKPCPATDRVAAAWTTTEAQNSAFTIDINITDGNTHQIALYCTDWLGTGTILEKIEIFESTDSAYSNPLDTRNFKVPSNGVYFVWKLSGHKKIRIIKLDATIGNKAMVSAVFFGGGG